MNPLCADATVEIALAIALVCGLIAVVATGFLIAGARRAGRARDRMGLARREDANGHALLLLANEIDAYAAGLGGDGHPAARARAWARLCRRVAAEHLACINALILESGSDIALDPASSTAGEEAPRGTERGRLNAEIVELFQPKSVDQDDRFRIPRARDSTTGRRRAG